MLSKVPFRPFVVFAAGSVAAVAGSIALGSFSAHATRPVQPPVDATPRMTPRPLFVSPRSPINSAVVVTEEVVRATVKNGVAETTVTYLLENRGGRPEAKADFLLPIPTGATVQNFALFDGETRLPAEMQNKETATATYEAIVRQRRDPALLTFEGRNLLRARVFPVIAGKPRKITLKLTTLLPREQSAVKYSWPLAGPHLPGAVIPQRVSVRVQVVGANEALYSPTHAVQIADGSGEASVTTATWNSDAKNGGSASLVENPEFTLYTTSTAKQAADSSAPVSLSLLTFRAGQTRVASASDTALPAPGGYFLIVATPNKEAARLPVPPRRVVLVLDRSGSMDGKKIEQARAALRFALGKLRAQDTFNVLTFSDKVESFAPEAVLGTKETIARAQTWVDAIDANGGTNINDALLAGLRQFPGKKTGNTLLFFTDGEPTVGTTSRAEIVRNALKQGDNRARAFVFGVGYDVDVPFLDNLAQTLRGDADYVRPDEDIEIKTSQFVEKTRNPVLENVSLQVEGASITDVYPRPGDMPDLFSGGQTVIVGRYTGAASDVRVTLAGETSGKKQTITLPARFPAKSDEAAFLPRLWASRKIGYLMATLAKEDAPTTTRAETVEQIKTLSKEWGILTPYTGMFVGEPTTPNTLGIAVDGFEPPTRASRPGLLSQQSNGGFGGGYRGAPAAPAPTLRSGAGAVDASQAGRAQRGQNQVGNFYAYAAKSAPAQQQEASLVRKLQTVGTRTFYLNNGVWQDARFDAAKQKELIKVQSFSPAYFALTRRSADWAKWASVGETVTIAANATQAVQFGSTGKETLTEAELNALIPANK